MTDKLCEICGSTCVVPSPNAHVVGESHFYGLMLETTEGEVKVLCGDHWIGLYSFLIDLYKRAGEETK